MIKHIWSTNLFRGVRTWGLLSTINNNLHHFRNCLSLGKGTCKSEAILLRGTLRNSIKSLKINFDSHACVMHNFVTQDHLCRATPLERNLQGKNSRGSSFSLFYRRNALCPVLRACSLHANYKWHEAQMTCLLCSVTFSAKCMLLKSLPPSLLFSVELGPTLISY